MEAADIRVLIDLRRIVEEGGQSYANFVIVSLDYLTSAVGILVHTFEVTARQSSVSAALIRKNYLLYGGRPPNTQKKVHREGTNQPTHTNQIQTETTRLKGSCF